MAKKKDKTTKILLIGGIGLVVYHLLKPKQVYNAYPNYPYIPPAPAPQTPEWVQWVNLVLNSAGTVADLWAPGGPFYNQNDDDVNDVINTGGSGGGNNSGYGSSGVPCWEDPYQPGC